MGIRKQHARKDTEINEAGKQYQDEIQGVELMHRRNSGRGLEVHMYVRSWINERVAFRLGQMDKGSDGCRSEKCRGRGEGADVCTCVSSPDSVDVLLSDEHMRELGYHFRGLVLAPMPQAFT